MRISEETLCIRSAERSDAAILNAWWNDGSVMAHAGYPNGLGQPLEETLRQIAANAQGPSQRSIIEENGVRIGEMSYRIHDRNAEIGIKICEKAYQNKGLGSRLLAMLIRFLFTDSSLNTPDKLDKIVLDTNLQNLRAQHVYEKLGFTRLRENINAWRNQLGAPQSSVDYEMTRESWQERVLIAPFWKRFLASAGRAPDTRYYSCFHFELSARWADELLALVLAGQKRATSSSLQSIELEGERMPKTGDLSIVTDWVGVPRCVIETTGVLTLPFQMMTYAIASREGEDDTLESWRRGHTRFFTEEGNTLGYEFSEDMPVVFEDFQVVYKE